MNFGEGYSLVNAVAQQNNAWNAEQVQKQMDFQERMSNTAHQREVADLKAAGLNPVLSAGGNGASTPEGASASADNTNASAMFGLVKMALEAQMQSAEAVSRVAGAGKASSSLESAIKSGLNGLLTNDAVRLAAEESEYERDRRAKREDTTTQSTENAKLFGLPVGIVFNAIARAKGYDNWSDLVEDRVDDYLVYSHNKEIGKKIESDLRSAKKKALVTDIRALGAK